MVGALSENAAGWPYCKWNDQIRPRRSAMSATIEMPTNEFGKNRDSNTSKGFIKNIRTMSLDFEGH